MRTMMTFLLLGVMVASCNEKPVPRPKAFFRIDLPESTYKTIQSDCPFEFEMNQRAFTIWREQPNQKCWFTLHYPENDAQIHFTYKTVESNLKQLLDESHQLSYEHHVKANDIISEVIIHDSTCVFGLVYHLEGDVASPIQFYLTDSTNHFMRGSLYFNTRMNSDSLQPVIAYLTNDIDQMISTFNWKSSRCN